MFNFNLSAEKFSEKTLYLYDLLRQLVIRDIKILYKRSVLGIAWTLINPLLQLAVFSFVFKIVLQVNIDRYSSFAFSGLLVWTWFQSSLFHATGLITGNPPMIRMPGFPVPILPVVTVMTGMIHFLMALPVLMLFLIIDGVRPTISLITLPFLLLLQFGLTVGCAYPLAALNVTFRDAQHTLGVLLQILFYMTPIFYDLQNLSPNLQWVYGLNPIVSLIQSYRAVLIYEQFPKTSSLIFLTLITAIILPLGYSIFKRQSGRFVEEL